MICPINGGRQLQKNIAFLLKIVYKSWFKKKLIIENKENRLVIDLVSISTRR